MQPFAAEPTCRHGAARPGRVPRRWAPRLVVVLVLILGSSMVPGVFRAHEIGEVRAVTVVYGVTRSVKTGDVLAHGQIVEDGGVRACEMPATTVGLTGTGPGKAIGAIRITDDCRAVVTAVEVEVMAPNLVATGSDTMHPTDSPGVRSFETVGDQLGQ